MECIYDHIGTKLIETNRLILRKFEITDSENMFKNWGSDFNVTQYLSWQAYKDIKDSEDIINLWISNNIINCLFKEIGINRICAKHDIENISSGEVMKKCNLNYQGTLREVQFRSNRFCSLAVY